MLSSQVKIINNKLRLSLPKEKKRYIEMVWYFIGAYTLKRTLHGRLEIRNSLLFVLKTISTPEEKFRISPRP